MAALNEALPFRAMLSIPVELGASLMAPEAWLGALASQVAWLVAFAGVAAWTWRRWLRRYEAFGA